MVKLQVFVQLANAACTIVQDGVDIIEVLLKPWNSGNKCASLS
jgi:hypothetical protein